MPKWLVEDPTLVYMLLGTVLVALIVGVFDGVMLDDEHADGGGGRF